MCFTGTRESAFVFALAAAVVSHSIAKACASGELPSCTCGPAPAEQAAPDFRWGGCGDNIRYGLQMGSAFSDAPMKNRRSGPQAFRVMHLHNNAVGRQVGLHITLPVLLWQGKNYFCIDVYVTDLSTYGCYKDHLTYSQVLMDAVETKCKCHGVSGSCSVKTCWKGLHDIGHIAEDLKTKYLSATKVIHRLVGTRRQLVPKELDVRPVREGELVYLVSSPDYCKTDAKHGSYGTQDR